MYFNFLLNKEGMGAGEPGNREWEMGNGEEWGAGETWSITCNYGASI